MLHDLIDNNVVLFGAGQNGQLMLERLVKEGITPVYFVDNNPKINHIESAAIADGRIAVKSPDVLLSEDKTKLKIIVTPADPFRIEIENQLNKMGFSEFVSHNTLAYTSCHYVNSSYMHFNNVLPGSRVALCCEPVENRPSTPFRSTPEETIEDFLNCHSLVLEEFKLQNVPRTISAVCEKCSQHITMPWNYDGLIHHINFGFNPSPCQAKCIYCHFIPSGKEPQYISPEIEAGYKQALDIVQCADDSGLFAPDITFVVTCGEITIHPYREMILGFIGNRRASFCTNCFIYSDKIASNLKANPKSVINLSIDAGTPETWHKVKGFDNFEKVLHNLTKYYEAGSQPGQITLNYIILPGINDSDKDFSSVIEIMKNLNVGSIKLSSDLQELYKRSAEQSEVLIQSAGRFVAMLKRAELMYNFKLYLQSELDRLLAYAETLL